MVKMSFSKVLENVKNFEPILFSGKVTQVVGTVVEGCLPNCSLGMLCDIFSGNSLSGVRAEVVGFRDDKVILIPFGEMRGIKLGSKIISKGITPKVGAGYELLGRVINGVGNPIDGKPLVSLKDEVPVYAEPINPFLRRRIRDPLDLGIRAINAFLTCGIGQRVAIMAGSGIGKSILLGIIARNTSADINVIGLIGERGRELKEFIERDLGEEGLKRSVVVAVTSDLSPLERVRGAFVATAIAEYFRNLGKNVLLMMDSITRFAMAQREIGLAAGEPPTTKGYTPSVFSFLPKIIERAGMSEKEGSITALYTVLVEGDDLTDPIADAVRALVDGHIVLSRDLADRNHYPAIDVLGSKSRVMIDIISEEHQRLAAKVQRLIASYRKAETLINIGAYSKGSNPEIDEAISKQDMINRFLQQGIFEKVNFDDSLRGLREVVINRK